MHQFGPAAKKRGLRTYTNSGDLDKPVHPHILDKIFAVKYKEIVEEMRRLAKILTLRVAIKLVLGFAICKCPKAPCVTGGPLYYFVLSVP